MNLKTKMIAAIGTVLLVVLCGAFVFIFQSQQAQSQALYRTQAKGISDSMRLVAKVVSGHKGIWVKEQEGVGPNPYLDEVLGPKATMKNAKGEQLYMRNGFAMITEISKAAEKNNMGFSYRAPSDKYLNPVNKPTAEELKVLNEMRKGGLEESTAKKTDNKGNSYYTYYNAHKADASCIAPCHMNYKLNAVEGISAVTMPITTAEAAMTDGLKKLAYIFVAALVLVMGVVYLLASRITSPIKQLAEAADRISMGDSNVVIDIKRKDEIGELADAFNRMAASIKILTMTEEELPPTGSDS